MFCQNCGTKLEDGAKFCGTCGNVVSEVRNAKKQESPTVQKTAHTSLPGIEGWLALLCFGLAVAPFIVGYDLLTSDGSGIVIFIDLVLLGLMFFIWHLIYKRDHRFAKFVVILLVVEALIGILGAIGTNGQDSSVFKPIVAAAVWIPYVLVSKRVKATFIA